LSNHLRAGLKNPAASRPPEVSHHTIPHTAQHYSYTALNIAPHSGTAGRTAPNIGLTSRHTAYALQDQPTSRSIGALSKRTAIAFNPDPSKWVRFLLHAIAGFFFFLPKGKEKNAPASRVFVFCLSPSAVQYSTVPVALGFIILTSFSYAMMLIDTSATVQQTPNPLIFPNLEEINRP